MNLKNKFMFIYIFFLNKKANGPILKLEALPINDSAPPHLYRYCLPPIHIYYWGDKIRFFVISFGFFFFDFFRIEKI